MCSFLPKPAVWQTPFIEKLVDSIEIDEIAISPSGDKVVYTVRHFSHERDKPISQLWLADVEVPGSGRKLTSDTHDHSIKWSPDGKMICFLSNKRDESYGLYGFQVSEIRPESILPRELYSKYYSKSDSTNDDPIQRISKFYFSPDSKRIAFLAPDEKHPEEKTREKAGDDVEVFGKWSYTRPYVLDFETFEPTKIYSKNAQVETMVWSPDGSQIMLVVHQTPELDSPFYSGIRFEMISVTGASASSSTLISEFPGSASWAQPVWLSSREIIFLAGATPTSTNSSITVYKLCQEGEVWSWSRYSHGEVDCVMDIRSQHGILFGEVQAGLFDEIHVLSRDGKREEVVLYSEKEKINAWDAKLLDNGGYVLAMSKSNTLNPTELYTVKIGNFDKNIEDIKCLGIEGDNKKNSDNLPLDASHLTKITFHNQDLAEAFAPNIISKVINCKSEDGTTDLDAIFIAPTVSPLKPLPTCVFIHGGPYERTTLSFNSNSNSHHWQAIILSLSLPSSNASYNSQNIALLYPNYRGGSGRGEKFASWTHSGVGTVEYDDIITLISEGTKLGLIDPERIIVGGWSQGGILSYLLATRRNIEAKLGDWKIKGAVCGAGGTDLDMLVMTSDRPFLEAEGIGGPPWDRERDDGIGENASALKRLRRKGVPESLPKMLLLHGKEDRRLPPSQAMAFRQACAGYGVQGKIEMAIYPREGHTLGERAHLIDILERVQSFCSCLLI